MVVGQLLDWVEGAPDGRRADAARALAQACLLVRTDSPERAAMEAALTVLLDQAQSDVRRALADAFADSETAPRHIVVTLAADQAGIAALVLSRSPLFIDAELTDLLPAASAPLRTAIARRPVVSAVVATAIAEAGDRDNCLALIDNAGAGLDRSGYARIADRFGEDPKVREALFGRPDLPPEIHQALVRRTADALGALVIGKAWLSEGRAVAVTREACERATTTIAAEAETPSLPGLVEHLRASGQLTTTLILRAACAGNLDFFEAALATLAKVPIERVANLVAARRLGALHAIYTKAGLPEMAFAAFAVALDIWGEVAEEGSDPDRYRTPSEVADAIIARYAGVTDSEGTAIATLLRRFAAEQAREAAYQYARAAA